MTKLSVDELKEKARRLRINVIKALYAAGSGHSGGSMGLADIFAVLYFNTLKHNPKDPDWKDRDRLILSIGHVVPVRYAAMAESGYFPKTELATLRKLGTRLQGHPHRLDLPGLELSGGSLGQGLGIAVGVALGAKMNNDKFLTYCSMGDGELQEGSIWEAAMAASHYKLNNLIGFVDRNKLQIDGNTEDIMALEPLDKKWESFGWNVLAANGNDVAEVVNAFDNAKAKLSEGKPVVILFNTFMGKGVSFMEDDHGWHGKSPSEEEAKKALVELGDKSGNLSFKVELDEDDADFDDGDDE